MGLAKRLLELDYSPSDLAVCLEHVNDRFLRLALTQELQELECFACGRSVSPDGIGKPFSVPLDEIITRVLEAIKRNFARAVEEVMWDSSEGGFVLPTDDSDEVVRRVCEDAFTEDYDGEIVEQILKSVDDDSWIERRVVDSAEYLWDAFSETVRHESRFMFLDLPTDEHVDEADNAGPFGLGKMRHNPSFAIASLLSTLASTINELGLIITEPTATPFYRGRLIENPHHGESSAEYLGLPPHDKAAANRMSPPGIVMLYASGDAQTAIKEIAGHGHQPYALVGAFRNTQPLRVIDLTRSSLVLNYFDEEGFSAYQASQFLSHFVDEITKPIIPDGREHREYVPTQVLTEYLRWGLSVAVDGIKLPSAQNGRPTYVLFFDDTTVADASTEQTSRRSSAPIVFTLATDDIQAFKVRRHYKGEPIPS